MALIVGSIFAPTVIAQDSQQLRVVEVVWGFDGRVVTGQFMPLSILVDNLKILEIIKRIVKVEKQIAESNNKLVKFNTTWKTFL